MHFSKDDLKNIKEPLSGQGTSVRYTEAFKQKTAELLKKGAQPCELSKESGVSSKYFYKLRSQIKAKEKLEIEDATEKDLLFVKKHVVHPQVLPKEPASEMPEPHSPIKNIIFPNGVKVEGIFSINELLSLGGVH